MAQEYMENESEEALTKSYDSRLIRRLLAYAKPYGLWIVLSIILLLAITGLELLRPILIGEAIDQFISGYKIPFAMMTEPSKAAFHGISYKDMDLVQDPKNMYPNREKAQIILWEERYYLLTHLNKEESQFFADLNQKHQQAVIIENESIHITKEDKIYTGQQLSKEDLKLLRQGDFQGLQRIGVLFLLILILSFLFSYIQTLILQYTGQKIIYNIRMEVFTHLQGLSLRFFDASPVGRLVTRVTNDTETLNEMYTSVLVNLFKNVFLLLGITVMMLKLNWKLTFLTFIVVPFIILFTAIFRKMSRKTYREVRTRVSRMNAFLSEHISGMKLIQIFAKEEEKFEEFDQINKDLNRSNMKELIIFGIFRPSMFFLSSVGLCIVLWFGGGNVIRGTLSIGTLFVFLQYINIFFQPVQELAEQFNIMQAAMASSERIFMLLDETVEIQETQEPVHLAEAKGKIEFKNVWFAYQEEEWVLKDVSFIIEPGQKVAFVGATGAGKTSILSLISRYYDVQKGQITIDGINIKDLETKELRSWIGQVLQDVFIFTGDIKSNIRLNELQITDEEVYQAAEYVNANRFIEKLPMGYQEEVKERGSTLSAGQRQLLSFARTLAFKPSILVLDEATANIDTETEQLIQDALYKLMEGRTTIMVAHRLSTIQHADQIMVMHKGRIREIGSHQALLQKQGIYYNLYQLQYQNA